MLKRIYLDGRTNSSLDWSISREEALGCTETIIWDLDLGLFAGLKRGLPDQTQFLSLALSLEHFRDTLWKEFKERTHSVCLYWGSVDFSKEFRWDDKQWENFLHWLNIRSGNELMSYCENRFAFEKHPEGAQLLRLFCRDTCVEYIQLLANRMPDGLNVSVRLNAAGFGILEELQLFHAERFERLDVIKENEGIKETSKAAIGVCVPPLEMCRVNQYLGLKEAIQKLKEAKRPFRLIPENHLITEWDGLDYLLVTPSGLSGQGKRKLQGFAAAGGIVVSLSNEMGLPEEISVEEFIH